MSSDKRLKVLIVDDSEMLNEILTMALQQFGHSVDSVNSFQAAVGICQKKEFDVILVDVRLMEGDGFDVVIELRKIIPSLPIVMMTGLDSADDPLKALELKVTDFIFKPFDVKELESCIKDAISNHRIPKTTVSEFFAFKQRARLTSKEHESPDLVKKLQLNALQLPIDDLIQLFELSTCVLAIARHDANNHLSNIMGYFHLIGHKLDRLMKIQEKEFDYSAVNKELLSLQKMLTKVSPSLEANRHFLSQFKKFELGENDSAFVTKPIRTIKMLQGLYPDNIFDCWDSDERLEIVFPENIFHGIVSELVINAIQHNKPNCKIMIFWKLSKNKFQCEVHDGGKGIIPQFAGKYVPLDMLNVIIKRESEGLYILNKVVSRANGLMLFGRSKILGGSLVKFEFPVLAHYCPQHE